MVVVDRWLALAIIGIIGMTVSAIGEFLGWWDQFGEWTFWLFLGFAITGLIGNATRQQAMDIKALLKEVLASSTRVEANTQRIEANTQRIEANTEGIVPLLREIRDRLPPPASP